MKIVHYPHPGLRHPVPPLLDINKNVRIQAGLMLELMYEAKGIGLAANQVLLPYQILVLNIISNPQQRDPEHVLINPTIVEQAGSVVSSEGCLSFPGLDLKVRRAKTVKVQAYNLKGEPIEITGYDLLGRVLQHEIDHLKGILYIDKAIPLSRSSCRKTIGEFELAFRQAQERGEVPLDKEIKEKLSRLAVLNV